MSNTWRIVSYVFLPLLLFISTACAQHFVIEVPVEEFHICFPARGENQDSAIQARGHAFNSHETGCI